MERVYKPLGKNHSKNKINIFTITLFMVFLCFYFFYCKNLNQKIEIVNIQKRQENIKMNIMDTEKNPVSVIKIPVSGIKMLYPTKNNGRTWFSKWDNEKAKILASGQTDSSDKEFIVRGNGTVVIDGDGTAHMKGDSPRMYVYDKTGNEKWNNVEVTVYAKRISETAILSSQGIVIGARSEHQKATLQNPCFGSTYYGRLLYDGRAVFQKEVIHEGAYSINKPSEKNKAEWNTSDGSMPKNVWIGLKFIIKNNPDDKSVKLELYRDLTDGYNGGTWEKVAEYVDSGDWAQSNSGIDVQKTCGYSADKILLDPGTSIFIRNDKIADVEYKLFSIREI